MAESFLFRFIYAPPPSVFVTAMSVISFASLAYSGVSEVRGKHLRYSKFWNVNSPKDGGATRVPSRTGMLVAYTPALVAAAASLAIPEVVAGGERSLLVSLALMLHFSKRDLEVLFIHQYSGQMMLDAVINISLGYTTSVVTWIYTQSLSQGIPEPMIDTKYAGIVLFAIGIAGNFYHHYLLAKLRSGGKGDKGYKIPKGGLFGLVICPHYLFEIIGFLGVCLISQTVYAFSFTLGSMFYLAGRSCATRRWYMSKFNDFPREIKALIPFLF